MPKIANPNDKARKHLYAGNQEELIRRTGMAASTFYYKKAKPVERLKGKELAALLLAQDMDPEEIQHVLRIFI